MTDETAQNVGSSEVKAGAAPRRARKPTTHKIRQSMRVFGKRILRAILHSRETPRAVAFGAAIGVFVAFTPTIGFQMLIAGTIATLLGASRLPAVIMVYISNPLTALPIYGFCYKIGSLLLSCFGVPQRDWTRLREFFSFSSNGPLLISVWRKFLDFLSVGGDMTLPLWVGSFVVGAVCAAISYPLVLRLVEGHRLIRAEKRARKLAKTHHEERRDI